MLLVTVPVEKLHEEPYGSVLCYPKPTATELQKRSEELKTLRVTEIEFEGKTSAFNVPILGKGYVGIVVAARIRGQRVALKIRRVDADRTGLEHEAEMLNKANAVSVGPRIISVTTNFLLMQLIDGNSLPNWLQTHKDNDVLRGILHDLLEQCWRLDNTGLDHGELSHAPKHLIVDMQQKPWIVDFETASINRKPANVTAICQFLFASNGTTARAIAEILGERNREHLITALRAYKQKRTGENFEQLLRTCLG